MSNSSRTLRMAEGYDGDKAAPLDEGMDEFLCEYVDGAMDPVVLQAFEEYLRANPEVAEHVQCLCQAKRFLSQQSACPHATSALQQRLRLAIAQEQLGNVHAGVTSGLGSFAWVTSAAGLMLMLGMLFGTAVVRYQAEVPQVYVERESAPSDSYRMQAVRMPSAVRPAFGPAPAIALPTISYSGLMTPVFQRDSLRTALAAP